MAEEMKVRVKPPLLLKESAVIVVDMQNDFVSPGGKYVQPDSLYAEMVQAIIAPIKEVLAFARRARMPIVYSQTQYYSNYIDAPRVSTARELVALKRGSWGAAIIDELAPAPNEDNALVLDCARYNKFHATNLDGILRTLGVRTLILTGTATNGCVESTARGARELDFYPVMLSDCVSTFTEEMQRATLVTIDRFFGSVMTSKELLGILEAQLYEPRLIMQSR